MDTTDPNIRFDSNGISDYYHHFKNSILPDWNFGINKLAELMKIAEKLKKENIPFSDYGTTFAKEWHQVFFHDPEGNVVEVHQNIK